MAETVAETEVVETAPPPAPEPKAEPKAAAPAEPPPKLTPEESWEKDLAKAYQKAQPKEDGEADADEEPPAKPAPLKAEKPAAEPEKPPADKAKADDKDAEGDDAGEQEAEDAALKSFPASLPKEVKEHWAKIPERARELLASHEKTLSAKVAEAGRKVQAAERLQQGLEPVRASLEDAVRKFPSMANMRPEEVAQRVTETAQTIEALAQDPLRVLLGEAQKRGLIDQMRNVLNGQPAGEDGQHTRQLMQTIEGLQRQVEQLSDPARFNQMIDQRDYERRVAGFNDMVSDYAKTAQHWDIVQERIPRYIELLQMEQPQLAGRDLLDTAYHRAITGLGLEQPRNDEPAPAPLQPSAPIDARQQIQAKNVNVPRRTEGTPQPLSLEAQLRNTFRTAKARQL